MYFSNMSSALYTFAGSSLKPFRNFSEQKSIAQVSMRSLNDRQNKLTGQVRVVILHVAATGIVQDSQLGLVGLGDVAKVLLVGAVHVLGVSLALTVTQVVPVGCSKSYLQVLDLLRGNQAGQILELVDISAADVLDLASADHSLTGLVTGLEEGSNIGSIRAEDV
jgi:hypothetical protein